VRSSWPAPPLGVDNGAENIGYRLQQIAVERDRAARGWTSHEAIYQALYVQGRGAHPRHGRPATAEGVDWFNHRRLYEYRGDISPVQPRTSTTLNTQPSRPLSSHTNNSSDSPGRFTHPRRVMLATKFRPRVGSSTTDRIDHGGRRPGVLSGA
jgi:hypothetical protein